MMRAAAALVVGHPFCPDLDPPFPPTGGFPDSGKECQWAGTTQNAQYHNVNNVTERGCAALCARARVVGAPAAARAAAAMTCGILESLEIKPYEYGILQPYGLGGAF